MKHKTTSKNQDVVQLMDVIIVENKGSLITATFRDDTKSIGVQGKGKTEPEAIKRLHLALKISYGYSNMYHYYRQKLAVAVTIRTRKELEEYNRWVHGAN